MRLLDAKTLELKEFHGSKVPSYAILSHTWEDGEVSFSEMQNFTPAVQAKSGYAKIRDACSLAYGQGFSYIWIDTCCIDKSSSAELTESINSMFKWYAKAKVCYAYLVDVNITTGHTEQSDVALSRWFTRGWTLQELLAPKDVRFHDTDWTFIGTRESLCSAISMATKIEIEFLSGQPLANASVAKRMSWAANRLTTRVEDQSYSLLGLFNVNMPLLYGEGERAFVRLQEEIIKISTDQSLFAWGGINSAGKHKALALLNSEPGLTRQSFSMLAKSPLAFAYSAKIVSYSNWRPKDAYQITNLGLRIKIPLLLCPISSTEPRWGIGILGCHYEDNFSGLLAVRLHHSADNVYYRSSGAMIFISRIDLPKPDFQEIYISQTQDLAAQFIQTRNEPVRSMFSTDRLKEALEGPKPPLMRLDLCHNSPQRLRVSDTLYGHYELSAGGSESLRLERIDPDLDGKHRISWHGALTLADCSGVSAPRFHLYLSLEVVIGEFESYLTGDRANIPRDDSVSGLQYRYTVLPADGPFSLDAMKTLEKTLASNLDMPEVLMFPQHYVFVRRINAAAANVIEFDYLNIWNDNDWLDSKLNHDDPLALFAAVKSIVKTGGLLDSNEGISSQPSSRLSRRPSHFSIPATPELVIPQLSRRPSRASILSKRTTN